MLLWVSIINAFNKIVSESNSPSCIFYHLSVVCFLYLPMPSKMTLISGFVEVLSLWKWSPGWRRCWTLSRSQPPQETSLWGKTAQTSASVKQHTKWCLLLLWFELNLACKGQILTFDLYASSFGAQISSLDSSLKVAEHQSILSLSLVD